MAAGLKARREAEAIRSACEADRKELIRKGSALDNRESRLHEKEEHLDREIKTKAENLIKADRTKLEWEYKTRVHDNDRWTKTKQAELSKKYKTMTVTYQVEFMAVLIYGLISSILQVITTPIIREDILTFFTGLWKGIVGLYYLIESLGRNAAGLAYLIENPTASSVVYWIVLIAVIVVLIGGVVFGFGFVLFLYGGYVRDNQWDRHTAIAVIADVATTLFLVEEIRAWIPINLIAIQMLLFLMYSGMRAWIQHSREYTII